MYLLTQCVWDGMLRQVDIMLVVITGQETNPNTLPILMPECHNFAH